jgi:hypothetical protein
MRNLLATCAVAVAVTAGTLFAPAPAQAWGYRHFGFYRPHVFVYRPYAYVYRPAFAYVYRPRVFYRPFYRPYAFYRPYRAYAYAGFGRPLWIGWRHRWR